MLIKKVFKTHKTLNNVKTIGIPNNFRQQSFTQFKIQQATTNWAPNKLINESIEMFSENSLNFFT